MVAYSAMTTSVFMIHPTEVFDVENRQLMSRALAAAVNTLRLGGTEPGDNLRLSMAQRIIAASAAGERTILSFTEAALDWQRPEAAA
jgi:hypothetical protein